MFLQEIGTLIVFVLIVDTIYFFIRLAKYKKTKQFVLKSELLKFIFVSYLVAVISVLLIPHAEFGITDDGRFFFFFCLPEFGYNFYPFRSILEHISMYKNGNPIGIINLLVNSCLFIPFPVLLKLNKPTLKLGYCFLIPFASIIVCEGLQHFLGRATDIDDVILNTAGVLVGVVFAQVIHKIINAKKQRFTKAI